MTEKDEPVLDPDLPIIDCHHHLFEGISPELAEHLKLRRFLVDDYAKLVGDGHRVVASVAVEAHSMFRADGPEELKAVGETEFLNGQAAMAASGVYGSCRVAAGIVAYADLSRGAGVRTLLEAHLAAAPARFKGIRQEGVWDADRQVHGGIFDVPAHLYGDAVFREGFAQLAPLGISFDAFVLASQLADVISLARDFPETTIVLNHVGSPVGIRGYQGRLRELFPQWRRDMAAIAECPNTTVKLGGLGSFLLGSAFYRSDPPADVAALVEEWRPYVDGAIELFGADRCMFESNLPTDGSGRFRTVCNAYKKMTANCSHEERAAIFAGTAARVYRLGDVASLAVGSAG
jgi:predicted TIM-barrel fold metal-dependent hydrolase